MYKKKKTGLIGIIITIHSINFIVVLFKYGYTKIIFCGKCFYAI